MNLLGRREVDVLGGGNEFHVFPGHELHLVALRLQVNVVLGGDEFDAGVAFARFDGAGDEADGLAGVDAGFAGDGEVGVFAAFQDEEFAVGELEVLSGDLGDAAFPGLKNDGVGEVGLFVLPGGGVLLLGVALGGVLILAVDHAAGYGVQGFDRGGFVVDPAFALALAALVAGKLDGVVGAGGLVEGSGEGVGLFEEGHGGGHVAGALPGVGVGPGGHDEALLGAQGAPGVGAQFNAGAAQGAAVVVGLVDEVAEVELAAVLGGGELQALLLVGVVEDELVVAGAAEFLALEAAERGRVAVALGGPAVPGGAVAAGGVALAAGVVVGGGVEQGVGFAGVAGVLAARGGEAAALPLAVVEGAEEIGAVDVATEEVDEDFLPDPGEPLPAHARAGLPAHDADPAGGLTFWRLGLLPVEANLDAAEGVAPEFVGAARGGAPIGTDDEGGHRAECGGPGVEAGAAAVLELRPPGLCRVVGVEAVAVAAFGGEFEEFGVEVIRGGNRLDGVAAAQVGVDRRGEVGEALGDGGDGFAAEVVDADMGDVGGEVFVFEGGLLRIGGQADEVETGAGTQAAHGAARQPGALAGFAGFHGEAAVAFGFAGIGPGVEAGVVVAFEDRGMLAADGLGTRHVEGDGFFGFVVVADGAEHAAGQTTLFAEGNDGVLGFLRVGAVIAQSASAVGGLGEDVFRETLAVGKEPQTMAGRGWLVFFNTPADAFFGQQAGYEGVVGFAVLHAVAARPGVGEELADFITPLPGGDVGVVGEDCFNDLDDGFVLEDTVMTAAAEQPNPGDEGNAVAGEAAVATELAG